jgi:hypothetical protein
MATTMSQQLRSCSQVSNASSSDADDKHHNGHSSYQSTQSSIPPDIWLRIARSSSPSGLNLLCRTSKPFLDLLRPTLYREVDLNNPRRAFGDTLRLLAFDRNLAKHVSNLRLRVPDSTDGTGQKRIPSYYMDAILNMISLKKLALVSNNSIFNDATEQRLFVESLSKRQTALEEFGLWGYLVKLPADEFPLSKLTSLKWSVKSGECYQPISLCVT